MRPARLLVLPLVAVLLAAGCGGGQATAPADPGTLLSEAGAAASGKHSARFQVVIEGRPMTFDMRKIGTTLYFEVPGGQWYSEHVGGLAPRAPQGSGPAGAVGALLEARRPAWIVGIGTRCDGRADAIDGELDPVAISTDVTRLLRQLRRYGVPHLPSPAI
jgi:hypothetical protein